MTELPMPAGPPCEGCGEEPAAMSLMNYVDYSQVRVGLNCAPGFLRTIADSIDGRETAAPEPAAETSSPAVPDEIPGSGPAAGDDPPDTDTETGSAKDHWASTTNVRRSTHGHRTPRAGAARPRKDEPE